MKRKRFTEEKIISILTAFDDGVEADELCRLHGMDKSSLYAWRRRYGGMEVSDAKRLRELEQENRRLKELVGDLSLDVQMLKAVNSKKW